MLEPRRGCQLQPDVWLLPGYIVLPLLACWAKVWQSAIMLIGHVCVNLASWAQPPTAFFSAHHHWVITFRHNVRETMWQAHLRLPCLPLCHHFDVFNPRIHCGLVMCRLLASPPELLVFLAELDDYFGNTLLFRTLLPTQTHSSHLMDQTLTHSHTNTSFAHPKYCIYTQTLSPLTLTFTLSVWCCVAQLDCCVFVFLFSIGPDFNILLQNIVTFSLMFI